MEKVESLLKQMNEILKQLVLNAETLAQLTSQVVSEEEIQPFQLRQEELIEQLKSLEVNSPKKLNDLSLKPYEELNKSIEEKIINFRKFNDVMIENLSRSKGVIAFEKPNKSTNKKKDS